MSVDDASGWVHLNAERSWMRGLQTISPLDFAPSDWWDFLLVIPLTLVYLVVLALLIGTVRRPEINVGESKLRVGRRIFDFAEINVSEVSAAGSKRSELMFGRTSGPKLYLPLTDRSATMITDETRAAVRKLLEGSSVPNDRKAKALKALS